MAYENMQALSAAWCEKTRLVMEREDIAFADLWDMFKQTFAAFAALNRDALVPREACQLLLDVLDFEFYVTLVDEASISAHASGVYHIVTALKNGLLKHDFTSTFLRLKATAAGLEEEPFSDYTLYRLDMEQEDMSDFVAFITSEIDDKYNGVMLCGFGT